MSACRAVAVQASLVHHQRVDLGEGPPQAVEILMVMERIAAGPVDQADVGIGPRLAVVAIGRAGIEQHVGDAGDRDEVGDAVAALRQRRRSAPHCCDARNRRSRPARSRSRRRAGRSGPSAAASTDAHPHRLLAMLGALQRMRHHDQGAPSVQPSRQRRDGVGRDPGDGGGPCRVLGLAVASRPAGSARTPASRPYSGRGMRDRAALRRPACAPAPASARCRCRGCW